MDGPVSAHSPALAAALAAARHQLPVFPLSRTKQPAIPSPHRGAPPGGEPPAPCRGECGLPGHGVHDATTDPAALRALFAAAPWATGYGIACCRPPHHLIGVDLDVKHGADSLAALQALGGVHGFTLPETVVVATPSGGLHLWFTGPPDAAVPNSASRLAPGIDVRGRGGYLTGPGSRTLAGGYRLAAGSALFPAPVPAALLRLLTAPPTPTAPPPRRAPGPPRTPDARAEALVRFVQRSRPGERNARLFWAACRAYESGHGSSLAQTLVDAATATGLTPREARAAVDSAARHQRRDRFPPSAC
ncbi:bifunctional DNA primase/polymerase [Streptomyces polyrhachis]|uniref:Bifunctional DNA primase/polymerase n=1 Tax=Streptomyces polyrhachis TaxID=1282885 RepID=A0ABW2GG38_9ACTN